MTQPRPESAAPIPAAHDDESRWRRQHPLSYLFHLFAAIRGLLLPLLVGAFSIQGIFLWIFFLGLFCLSAVSGFLSYWRYRYFLGEDEMIVEEGVLHRSIRHIPYHRIQNVSLVRNPIHRILRVQGLQLESASGAEPEAVMQAVSDSAIQRIEAMVALAREAHDPQDADVSGDPAMESTLVTTSAGELLRLGLASNRGLVVVSALVGFFFQQFFTGANNLVFMRWMESWWNKLAAQIPAGLAGSLFFLVALLAGLVALRALSVAYAFFRFHNFTLTMQGENLRASFGLLTKRSASARRSRIQQVGVRSNLLHRAFGRVSVSMQTAGQLSAGGEGPSLHWLAPILPRDGLDPLLRQVLPKLPWGEWAWKPLHPLSWRRLARIRILQSLLLSVSGIAVFGWSGFWFLTVAIPLLLQARGDLRFRRWSISPEGMALRGGWLVQSHSFVPVSRIQVVSLTQSPFDRRWGMACVSIETAGGEVGGQEFKIRFLPEEVARSLYLEIRALLRKTRFVW